MVLYCKGNMQNLLHDVPLCIGLPNWTDETDELSGAFSCWWFDEWGNVWWLQAADWSLDHAIDSYYAGHNVAPRTSSSGVVEAAFKKYCDPQEGIINVEGVQRLCADLHVGSALSL